MSSDFTFIINMAGDEDEKKGKGMKVKLETFKRWNIDFGYKEEDGLVCKIWCKLCRQHIDKIARDDKLPYVGRFKSLDHWMNSGLCHLLSFVFSHHDYITVKSVRTTY